jgi:4,5-dihydroxyphthalate decarboxylase
VASKRKPVRRKAKTKPAAAPARASNSPLSNSMISTSPEPRPKLTVAMSDYDHVRDFASGTVRAEGIDVTFLTLSIEEIFFRFVKFREWDVSELSMGKYVSLVSQNDKSLVGIPVFPSRILRQQSIYVRRDGNVKTPTDLKGRKVGIPEWAQTASIYSRGYLVHDCGLKLDDIEWHQAGVNQPGRGEKVQLKIPAGISYRARPDKSLNQMLLSGELDAVLSAHAPDAFEQGDPRIVRMFPNYRPIEEEYFKRTGIFPIMHVTVMKREVYDRNPWIAGNLMSAFEEAKRRSITRMFDTTAPRVPIPWCYAYAEDARALMGENYWPYGLEPNRTTLEAFLKFAYEQGVCHRPLTPEELFPPQLHASFRV